MPLPEKELISKLRHQSAGKPRLGSVRIGIGDDCAVLRIPAGHEALVTTDFSLEGIHFRRDWDAPEVIGHRCLTRGLSDIAAMGGEPIAAWLSLALPLSVSQKWVDGFMRGLLRLARRFGVQLAGGDTAEALRDIAADIVVLGSVPQGKAVLRSGARPGDRIYVTGALGGSAAAIASLLHSGALARPADYPQHFRPLPRVEVGKRLRGIASAMIDVSDGMSTDLAHLCEESRVGAEINAESIPRARVGRTRREVLREAALHGGDDYELLFTAAKGKRVPFQMAGIPVTEIGEITRKGKIMLMGDGLARELKPLGWEHFTR